MCGMLVTNVLDFNADEAMRLVRFRGPDAISVKTVNDVKFVHCLLHITGKKVEQPFIKGDIVCVYNGEIYNYKDFGQYETDGECLIDLYEKHGDTFTSLLDGEFAIVIADYVNRKIIVFTDPFSTKPVWASFGKRFGVASYKSSLVSVGLPDIIKLRANAAYVYNMDNSKLEIKESLVKWDLKQHKENYDEWIDAFQNSITKRTTNLEKSVFFGLSSGYDSGAIACELTRQGSPFSAYTVMATENQGIVKERHSRLKNGTIIHATWDDWKKAKVHLKEKCEKFSYRDKFNKYDLMKDMGAYGIVMLFDAAKKDGHKIYLSGQGSDEIISDYGFRGQKIRTHSEFGGKFPKKLEGFFPWHSFYDGTQIKYMTKEEHIAGSFGMETRYPFLDKRLVQEFLWLTAELKNKKYKAPIYEYLTKCKYPFEDGKKRGFRAKDNLVKV